MFDMECKIRELDQYKKSYTHLTDEVHATHERIEAFMLQQAGGLTTFMQKGNEKMLKMEDRLLKLEEKSLDHKFSIDKLLSQTKG